ncbi:hypothetical protein PGT21_019582 [Puccinia graminis f. sp. tritici]|uniref:Uncharacterized protein n=1 Tax=Puccinia graminis f. sp. tritici TaxID=56615 RepID=A0A5B0Q318_PUCGR|nr:hypothetical protein PGT21_019582 [Puccinia graminis f. sp. tritici]
MPEISNTSTSHKHCPNRTSTLERLCKRSTLRFVPVRPRLRYEFLRPGLHSTVFLAAPSFSADSPPIPLSCNSQRTVPTDPAGSCRPPIAEIVLISSDTESTLSDDEIDEEMSENDAIADGTSDDDRSLSDQADPYSYHLIFMASSEASDTDTDASASDVSNDEPGAPPPSHVATDEELRALEREVFDYDPSVDDSWYTTDDDSNADSEMSDIPAPPVPHSPRNFPLHKIRDLDVDVIVDPRLQYNPFRFFPVHTLPVIPPANPPSLPRRMFESVFIDLVDRLRHLLAMLSAGQPIYHQIDVCSTSV